ncbi:unnamed protein product [Cochlearia groenlandica]
MSSSQKSLAPSGSASRPATKRVDRSAAPNEQIRRGDADYFPWRVRLLTALVIYLRWGCRSPLLVPRVLFGWTLLRSERKYRQRVS